MDPARWEVVLSIGLFAAMVACLEVGYRMGRRGSAEHSDVVYKGVGTVEAAVFALLGLLLAFFFSGATSRLDARRQLIVQEANAIGTGYLRLDLLPAADQPGVRRLFREYLDARLRVYDKLPDLPAAEEEISHAQQIQ